MSGPVGTQDLPADPVPTGPTARTPVVVTSGRDAEVGRMPVRRVLPRRARRTVGAWCFADEMGPAEVTETSGLDIGPHPHTGLATVTWLVSGEVLHRDSLGTEQVVRAGQLNLMTAGHGVSHAEEATGSYRGPLQGVQLWVAQPEGTRHGPAAFEHHAVLPQVDLDRAVATVLVGELAGAASPARHDTPLLGVDLQARPGTSTLPLEPRFEHALLVLDGELLVDDQPVRPGELAYVGTGRDELAVTALDPARALVLGGEPLEEELVMWWNFVGRSRQEIADAARQWRSDDPRFGDPGSPLDRIPAPPVPWAR